MPLILARIASLTIALPVLGKDPFDESAVQVKVKTALA